MFEEPRCIAT
jgi:hypothetical protein